MDHCTSRGRNSTRTESVVYIGQKIGHCVKHIHREHHQEADHMAKWEAEGDMNVIVEGFQNHEGVANDTRQVGRKYKTHVATVDVAFQLERWIGKVGHSQQQICTFEDQCCQGGRTCWRPHPNIIP